MHIYIASSFRNMHLVQSIQQSLRQMIPNVQFFDWTEKATPPAGLNAASRRAWMDTDAGGDIFGFCKDSCSNADLLIYLGDSGKDACIEVGMAYAQGVPIIGLAGPLEDAGLMLHGAVDIWVDSVNKLYEKVYRFISCSNAVGTVPCDCPLEKLCNVREIGRL